MKATINPRFVQGRLFCPGPFGAASQRGGGRSKPIQAAQQFQSRSTKNPTALHQVGWLGKEPVVFTEKGWAEPSSFSPRYLGPFALPGLEAPRSPSLALPGEIEESKTPTVDIVAWKAERPGQGAPATLDWLLQ